jgi:hypothetical protein
MCSFLWNEQDPATIIYNLRLYDMVRRLYFVKTGSEPMHEDILELMTFVKSDRELYAVFMVYVRAGKFPDNAIIEKIHNG